jgi:hypothetical protein
MDDGPIASRTAPPMSFGKRLKRPLRRPLKPSAFDAAEPPDSQPLAPAVTATASPARGTGLRHYGRRIFWVYPRVAALAAATVTSFALAAAIMLTRTPEQAADTGSTVSAIAAADPAPAARANDPGAGIRFVDPAPETPVSCDKATWPYIDPRCFAPAKTETDVKKEARKDIKRSGKIGPRPIDPGSNPLAQAPDHDMPIGSMTAIAPANPKVSTTDGVATDAPAAMERTYKSDRVGEVIDRTGTAKKKKKGRQVAQVKQKPGAEQAAGAPQAQPFIFPFSLFSQVR